MLAILSAIFLACLALCAFVAVTCRGRACAICDEEETLLRPISPNDTIVNPKDYLERP